MAAAESIRSIGRSWSRRLSRPQARGVNVRSTTPKPGPWIPSRRLRSRPLAIPAHAQMPRTRSRPRPLPGAACSVLRWRRALANSTPERLRTDPTGFGPASIRSVCRMRFHNTRRRSSGTHNQDSRNSSRHRSRRRRLRRARLQERPPPPPRTGNRAGSIHIRTADTARNSPAPHTRSQAGRLHDGRRRERRGSPSREKTRQPERHATVAP